jgi:glycosyltransferase involved in cell wall biosynthesis
MYSIIVTTYKCEKTFSSCIESILNQDFQNIELIVVDSSPSDCISRIVMQYPKARYIRSESYERSSKRNEGAIKAHGKYVVIIDSDMVLEKTVISECENAFKNNSNLKMLCIPERSSGVGFWSKCKEYERSLYDNYIWMQAARVFNKEIFLQFKGYDPENIGSEDYDLPRRVEFEYGASCLSIIKSTLTQQEGVITLVGQIKKKFYYSKSFIKYSKNNETIGDFKLQTSILTRYRILIRHFNKRQNSIITLIGAIFLKTIEFIAGGLGFIYYTAVSYAFK